MVDNFERFDMKKGPKKCCLLFRSIMWAVSFYATKKHKTKINKIGMENIKPPYLLLGNHNAFYDMNVSIRATFPHFPNYVVAIDGYLGREWLLRSIGCICKRKFTNNISLVQHLKTVVDRGGIPAIYPEARYSLCGTTAPLPESLGKLIKHLNIPVVTLMTNGHHINHPFWNTRHERNVIPTEATMRLLLSKEDVNNLSADDINDKLVENFKYDDFMWQLKNKIHVNCPDRAVGLEKILYQCPHCNTEFMMKSHDSTLSCESCGKEWEMTEFGELVAKDGITEFTHIPTWYEWERGNVKKEVEAGTYSSGELDVNVMSLPNAKKFIDLGVGKLIHDMNGFRVNVTDKDGDVHTMEKLVQTLYSCHVEFEYLFKYGDLVDLNTLTDTWYCRPLNGKFSVTKMALATEELYFANKRLSGKTCKEGLA